MAAVPQQAAALFEVLATARVAPSVLLPSAHGAVAELEAQALLVARGHKVAVPVVDDDGVDLIVDYRTLVQVKTTRQVNSQGVPHVQFKRNSYQRRRDGSLRNRGGRGLPPHVDVVLVQVAGVGWYVVPRASVPSSGIVFGPGMDQWREAWDVFD